MSRYLPYIFLLISFTACAQSEETFDEMVRRMSSPKVALVMPDDIPTNAILIDCREQDEIDVSRIPGAISDKEFERKESQNPSLKTPVVVYCSVGYRSGQYAEELQEKGYLEVYNLYGGIFHWVNEDHNVVNTQGAKTDTVHTYNKKWSQWLYKGEKTW